MYGYDSAFFKRNLVSILSGCKDMFIFIKYLFSKYIQQKCKTEDDLVSEIILTPPRPPPVLVRIESLRKPACILVYLYAGRWCYQCKIWLGLKIMFYNTINDGQISKCWWIIFINNVSLCFDAKTQKCLHPCYYGGVWPVK